MIKHISWDRELGIKTVHIGDSKVADFNIENIYEMVMSMINGKGKVRYYRSSI